MGVCQLVSVRRGWGCPVLETTSSSRLQTTHCTAQLSLAAVGECLGKSLSKEGQNTGQSDGGMKTEIVRNSSMSTEMREGGGGGGLSFWRLFVPSPTACPKQV